MSRKGPAAPRAAIPRTGTPRITTPSAISRPERIWVPALLVLHAVLGLWVSRSNSVTFDETFHVPAGVRILAAGDFATSYAQPPLAKTLYGLAAMAAGARDPGSAQAGPGRERYVGYAFMRENAARFVRVYGAARLVALVFSLALAVMVWRTARRRYGPTAGLAALALWAILPETLAQSAIAGVDLPTALVFFGATLAWLDFLREGGRARWAVAALWIAAAFLTRFSAVQLVVALLAITAFAVWHGLVAHPSRAWLGLALLPLVAVAAIDLGYGLQVSLRPLSSMTFQSASFMALQRSLPALRLPLPDAWILGVDYLGYLSQTGAKNSFLLGQIRTHHEWGYFPVAIAVKWPVALLGWTAARATSWGRRVAAASLDEIADVAVMLVVLLSCMAANLNYGIRYLFPLLPFLAVWLAGLVAGGKNGRRALAGVLVAAIALESARAMPYPLSFFNGFGGGPGRGDRIVNDSNVDWGQGLVALRHDMERRGIRRIYLAYHGTVDPAMYGVDYIIYGGGQPGNESDWIAVSSYFLVGLASRLTSSQGISEDPVYYDFGRLRTREPVARPAGCMYLFRLR